MIDRQQLLRDLQTLLPKIEQDILAYTESKLELDAHLRGEYAKAKAANRTAEHFVAWREAQITQAAVAWMLTCVFVRFLEDNALLDAPLISGPAGSHKQSRLQQAKDRLTVYFNDHPTHAERDYLQDLFTELEQLPALAELLDRAHNPLWQLPLSGDGAKQLIDFFQRLDPETGEIVHDFTDPQWDTRFLGDLYQDLSESVRKRYALLQTPEFVEGFILDYTLEPAKATFGLPGLRLIDPTCGSGHFLLTSFERLFDDWVKREPATNSRALAQRALDAVHGVDINPYAIAIARFRLLIAAMKAAGSDKIKAAPDFRFNLAVGDSLLHGQRHEWRGQGIQADLIDDDLAHVFEVEDKEKLERILGRRYHVVVGNPPYITVKDKALNRAYRDKYVTCHRQYSLGVPFTERFFDLTLAAEDNHPAGFMGMITTNSFMKREFGKKLIEDYLPKKELTHVIDTSGAYIPGHGTPTVILFARNQRPQGEQVRAVLGIRGEPSTPEDAAQGKVWRSIVGLLEKPGSENEFISVVDQERRLYAKHPWSVGGGGAADLKALLERDDFDTLDKSIREIGRTTHTGEDAVFYMPRNVIVARGMLNNAAPLVVGEQVRDWDIAAGEWSLMPYDLDTGNTLSILPEVISRHFWAFRRQLRNRKDFGQFIEERGLIWYEHSMFFPQRFRTPLSITFAFVATHNHFVLDRGGKVFKQSAPVIKLPAEATEADHLALLGLLNSSTACFWMKQVFHNKGATSDRGILQDDPEKFRFEFDGTKLKLFPIPDLPEDEHHKLIQLAGALDTAGASLSKFSFPQFVDEVLSEGALFKDEVGRVISERQAVREKMVRWQEELDWLCYELYGLISNSDPAKSMIHEQNVDDMPPLDKNARLYRCLGAEQTDPKSRSRRSAIEKSRGIALIEKPEFKRRWFRSAGAYDDRDLTDHIQFPRWMKEWLLDRLETYSHEPELLTVAQLADRTRQDDAFQQVAALYTGSDTFDVQSLVSDLVTTDNVPQMAAARYKPKALPKFRVWQETWDKQRAEDAIDARTELDESDPEYLTEEQATALKAKQIGAIPLPPKYASTDFRKPSYWPLRGKLDVPKERFFSLPHCEKAGDNTLVIGWAGLNHLQRAQAIAGWYIERKEQEGWDAERLKPMLAALDELIPWLKQWYNDIAPEYGERLGDYYEGFLAEELRQLELSRDELAEWEPPAAQRGRGKKKSVTRRREDAKKN